MSNLTAQIISRISRESKAKLRAMANAAGLPLGTYIRLVHEQHISTPLKIELVKKGKS